MHFSGQDGLTVAADGSQTLFELLELRSQCAAVEQQYPGGIRRDEACDERTDQRARIGAVFAVTLLPVLNREVVHLSEYIYVYKKEYSKAHAKLKTLVGKCEAD